MRQGRKRSLSALMTTSQHYAVELADLLYASVTTRFQFIAFTSTTNDRNSYEGKLRNIALADSTW
jgi:hypothetical protein